MRPSAQDRRPSNRRWLLGVGAVIAVAAGLHARTAGFGFSYLDDDVLIVGDQAFLSQRSSPWRAFARAYFPGAERDHVYYRPFVTATYAVDARLAGAHAPAYHRTNVILHAIASALLFMLLRRLSHGNGVALWGGLVFAAHPALTQAVAWIPGRNDLLLTVFALGAWLCLPRANPSRPRRHPVVAAAHLLLWACALFTKETAIVLPAVWVAHRRFVDRRSGKDVAPLGLVGGWIAVVIIYAAARAVVSRHSGGIGVGVGVGASPALVLGNLPMLLTSLGKLVLPFNLSVLATAEDTPLWPGVLSVLLIGAVLSLHAARRAPAPEGTAAAPRASRFPVRRHLLFGAACFVAFLAPALPASNLLVLENRLYLPAVGVLIMVCAVAEWATWPRPAMAAAAGAVIVTTLAYAMWSYESNFRDRLTFSLAAVHGSPHAALAHRNLGVTHHVAGDIAAAQLSYEAALALDPAEPVVHNNLAVIAMAEGRLADAESLLRRELVIQPRYAPAHRNLALVLRALGRVDEAAEHWQAAADLGDRADLEALRALASYHAGRDPEKAAHYRRLLDDAASPPGTGATAPIIR